MTGQWPKRLGVLFAVWVIVLAVSLLAETHPQPVLLAALLLLIAVLGWLAVDLSDGVAVQRWDTWSLSSDRRRGGDIRVSALQRALDDVATRQDAARLHPVLVELVDDRLDAHHGVDRTRDPARARELMGDELAAFVASPPPPVTFGNRAFLSRILGHIEAL